MLLLLTTNGASERLGHRSVVITLETRSHELLTMRQDVIDRIWRGLHREMGEE